MNARGSRPTPSSRWRRTLSSPRLITGKFTDTAHLLETHTSWGYCRWCKKHWGGVSSRDRELLSRDSNLKSCVVTRVVRISVFPVSRVTDFHVEGDATVDEGDACLIGQTVIDISRFHFSYSCLFVFPWSILPDLKHNEPNQLLCNAGWNLMGSDGMITHFDTGPDTQLITRGVEVWATSLRSTTDISISDWQMHSRPAGDNADNVIASFSSSSWPSIQLYILSNVSYNHLKKIMFELEVTVVTERDDSYEVRSSQTERDSQRYLLAMVYHVECIRCEQFCS